MILRQLRDEGVTIILTSHILAELQERVDRLAIMADGKILAIGSVQLLREQMDLPLRLEVLASDSGAADVRRALQPLPVSEQLWQGTQMHARCPREAKMAVLAALSGLGAAVLDLKVHEPSLEDVFFGYAD